MNINSMLSNLVRVIAAEAKKNPTFNAALITALRPQDSHLKNKANESMTNDKGQPGRKRPKNRRAHAAIDPILQIKSGSDNLRAQLQMLALEQLRDIIAEYGMDPGNKAMRWKDNQKVIEFIVEISRLRDSKGDAFMK